MNRTCFDSTYKHWRGGGQKTTPQLTNVHLPFCPSHIETKQLVLPNFCSLGCLECKGQILYCWHFCNTIFPQISLQLSRSPFWCCAAGRTFHSFRWGCPSTTRPRLDLLTRLTTLNRLGRILSGLAALKRLERNHPYSCARYHPHGLHQEVLSSPLASQKRTG